jgi:hypothetical protein
MTLRSLALVPVMLAALVGNGSRAFLDRSLSADWTYGEAIENGDLVSVPLTVRLRNDSSIDRLGAALVVVDELGSVDIGVLPTTFDLRGGGSALISGTLEVPVREFRRWERGELPIVLLQTQVDADVFRYAVELGRRAPHVD